MKTVLILGATNPVTHQVANNLKQQGISVVIYNEDPKSIAKYQAVLTTHEITTVLCTYGPMDVDWYVESFYEALRLNHQSIDHFILLSVIGVNNEQEEPLQYEGVTDQREYLLQQQYAIKVVDEAEMPYTIIRQSRVVIGAPKPYQLYWEGQVMPVGTVTEGTVAAICTDAILHHHYVNESIGIMNN